MVSSYSAMPAISAYKLGVAMWYINFKCSSVLLEAIRITDGETQACRAAGVAVKVTHDERKEVQHRHPNDGRLVVVDHALTRLHDSEGETVTDNTTVFEVWLARELGELLRVMISTRRSTFSIVLPNTASSTCLFRSQVFKWCRT